MIRTRILSGLTSLLLLAAGVGALPCAAQEATPNSSALTDTRPLRKLGKMDVRHPLHVGSAYYPKQSLKSREQGRCTVAFFIQADGTVTAAQMLKSTGFPRLDTACFESVIGVPLIPGAVNGAPTAGWYDFNIVWVIDHAQPYQPPSEKPAYPCVADDYELQAGDKYYPEAARAKHEKGYCVVHATVGSTGAVLNAAITRSTGSTLLDQACLIALKNARFTPELQDGQPIADSTDIAMYW